MKKYHVAIAGYGWAASAHIPAINATGKAAVTTIQSSRAQDAKALSAQYGCEIRTTTDFNDLLRDPAIDVIDITGLPNRHAQQFIAAAEAGKHIIVEKPLAMSLADCRAMSAAAQKAGVRTCVCFELRFCGQVTTTRALINEDLLGEVHYGEVDYYHGIGPWYGQFRWNTGRKDGGSALLTAGCHALDALLLFMGSEVESVTSMSTKSRGDIFKPYEYDTSSVTLVRFKNGAVGKCAAIVDCLQPYYFHTHLVGSEGSVLDDKFHSTKLKSDKSHWSKLSMQLADSGDVSDHPYQMQFQAFFDALDAGQDMPLTSFKESLRTFEVIFAADQSAAAGGAVVRVG